jgi:hypothetical protein
MHIQGWHFIQSNNGCRIDEYHDLIVCKRYIILCFISSDFTSGSIGEETYARITTAIPPERLSIVNVNLDESPDISLFAEVKEEMMLVFEKGKEIARHLGIAPDELEYVVSRTLCGLGASEQGFTQAICSKI